MDATQRLATAPRFDTAYLDIRPVAATSEPATIRDRMSSITLRVFTADPLEGDREPEWMFAANRTEPEHELVVYLSYGYAELEADDTGWEAVLRRATGRGLALWDQHPELVERGHLTIDPLAEALPEPIDVEIESFRTDGWRRGNLGIPVDMAEIETGEVAFDPVVVDPLPAEVPEPSCPACGGEPIRLVYMLPEYVDSLCGLHREQHGDAQSAAARGEGFRVTGQYALLMTPELAGSIVTGFSARARRARHSTDIEDEEAFLEWILDTFDGRSEEFTLAMDDDIDRADAVYLALERVGEERPERAIELGESLGDLIDPERRWRFDMAYVDELREVGRTDEAFAILEGWVDRASAEPFFYGPAGERYATWGEHEAAFDAFTKLYGTAVADGDEREARYALHRLKESAKELGRREKVAEALALIALIEAQGIGSLQRGRNEPCVCGSGVKTKRCCGGRRRHAR